MSEQQTVALLNRLQMPEGKVFTKCLAPLEIFTNLKQKKSISHNFLKTEIPLKLYKVYLILKYSIEVPLLFAG